MQDYIEINNKRYSVEYINKQINLIYDLFYNFVKNINDIIRYNEKLCNFVNKSITEIVVSRNSIKLCLISLFKKDYFVFKKENVNIRHLFDILFSNEIDNYIEQYFQNNLLELKDNNEFGYKVTDGWYSRFYKILYEKRFKALNISLNEFFDMFLRSMFIVIILYTYLEDFILDIFVKSNLEHLNVNLRSKIVELRNKINEFNASFNYNKNILDTFVKEHWINIKSILENTRYSISMKDNEKVKNGFDELSSYVSSISLGNISIIVNELKNKMNEISSLYRNIITLNVNGNDINVVAIINEAIQNILKNFYRY